MPKTSFFTIIPHGLAIHDHLSHVLVVADSSTLVQAYYHFCRGHQSPRMEYTFTNQAGTLLQRYQQRTPAMAAGWTRHHWSVSELILYPLPATMLQCVWRTEIKEYVVNLPAPPNLLSKCALLERKSTQNVAA